MYKSAIVLVLKADGQQLAAKGDYRLIGGLLFKSSLIGEKESSHLSLMLTARHSCHSYRFFF